MMILAVDRVEAGDYEGSIISQVKIRYSGYRSLEARDEENLRSRISSKIGSEFRKAVLHDDAKSIYESGLVTDVSFFGESGTIFGEPVKGEVQLVFVMRVKPTTFKGIKFVGNSVFSDGKLTEECGFKGDAFPSDDQIMGARSEIESHYLHHGYADVAVSFRLHEDSDGSSTLVFTIEEGAKLEIRNIHFEGVSTINESDIRDIMKTKEKDPSSLMSGYLFPEQLDADLDAVLDAYRNKGYLRASSMGIIRQPVEDGVVDLIISIVEGAKYTVAEVNFGTMSVVKPEELYPSLSLVGEQPYSSKKMREDIIMIRSFYGSRGYADVMVSPDIHDVNHNRLNITYRIIEGSRFRVGRVNIAGNTKTKDKVIRREILLKPGDMFNSVKLDMTKARLENLQYFSDVQVISSPSDSSLGSGYRDVNVFVVEKVTGTIGVSVSASSVSGITGHFEVFSSNLELIEEGDTSGGGVSGKVVCDFSQAGITAELQIEVLAIGDKMVYLPSDWRPKESPKRSEKGPVAKEPH